MRNRFDEEMQTLHRYMLEMGALCESAIASAAKAILEHDEKNARRAIALERETNEKEQEIESLCMKLLLRQQPVARDFRQISSVLKMITDMERIGDQAEDIAEIALLGNVKDSENNKTIRDMAVATIGMVTGAVNAYVDQDVELAHEVLASDDVVDDLFDKAKREMVKHLAEAPQDAEGIVDLLMVAKYLERIGDHATNIAEWVIFAVTGTHHKFLPEEDK